MEAVVYRSILLFFIYGLSTNFISCQEPEIAISSLRNDSLSLKEFDNAIHVLLENEDLVYETKEDLIFLVRLYNTIITESLQGKLYSDYAEMFTHKYFKICIVELEAQHGSSMTIYCPKYDLYIDVGLSFNSNSVIYLEDD